MRINDKIKEIENYLIELEEIILSNLDEYLRDFKSKATCERYFEKIIESAVDLVYLIIKEKNLKSPEEDKETFDILTEEKIISPELSIKLKEAKGMRNIITHEYGKVDDEIVFEAITTKLIRDIEEFIKLIKEEKK